MDRCAISNCIVYFFRDGIRQGRLYLEGGDVTECSEMYKEVCPTHLWNAHVLKTKGDIYDNALGHDYTINDQQNIFRNLRFP